MPAIRFIYSDTYLMGTAFQVWAFAEARRLGILRWWVASVLMTFGVGAGTAVPFFLLVRDTAATRTASTSPDTPYRDRVVRTIAT
ncbi:DUF2834 domain-containing protein [Mycobacteroides chelonae]|uniref:DUF2834 domain-containing protein n=1 Tax=Mycobacteroides chelonae TaxID=1774 RepID=UPI00307634FB